MLDFNVRVVVRLRERGSVPDGFLRLKREFFVFIGFPEYKDTKRRVPGNIGGQRDEKE